MKPIKHINLFTIYAILAILASFLILAPTIAATFYVNATNGNDSNTGTSETAPWKSIAKVNSSSFQPGDFILFKRGEIWREQLNVPSSGSDGNPITFGAYAVGNLPIFNGTEDFSDQSNWIAYENSNAYRSKIKIPFGLVIQNGNNLTPNVNSIESLSEGEFYRDSNNFVWIYPNGGEPPFKYSIDVAARDSCIIINDKEYITVENIAVSASKFYGLHIKGSSKMVLIDNIVAKWNGISGIQIYDESDRVSTKIIIQNCETSLNYQHGIGVLEENNNITIQRNNSHHNALADDHTLTAGIKVKSENNKRSNNIIIRNNVSYSNGKGLTSNRGYGIYVDTVGEGCVINFNETYENNANGIVVEYTDNALISYNLSYSNKWGIVLWRSSQNNQIVNNTVYGNLTGIVISGSGSPDPIGMNNNEIVNNISFGNTSFQLEATSGGGNDGINGLGNVYINNCFGNESFGFIFWNSTLFSTYDSWEIAVGTKTFSIRESPLFKDPPNDFKLKINSPVIDAGVNVGFTKDFLGNSIQGLPDIGAFEFQKIPPPINFKMIHIFHS